MANRDTVQARYLAGLVVSLCVAAGGMTRWLDGLGLDTTTYLACAGCAILLIAIIVELSASIGRRAADWFVPVALVVLWPYEILIAPLAFLTGGFTYALKWRRKADPKIIEAEVELMVDQGERAGLIEHKEAELMRNVIEFSDLVTRTAMIPRKKVVAIQIDTPFDEVLRTVTETGHSRYPVYRSDLDDIFGLLYAKDLFRVVKKSWRPPPPDSGTQPNDSSPDDVNGHIAQPVGRLHDIVREPVKFVSESTPLQALLTEMRQDAQHLAVVVDEFGGTSGVVTLEDVLEEIVGDIQDEYDQEEVPIVDLGEGRLIANASVLVSELSAYLGQELDPDAKYDSLAGMLIETTGSVPDEGTTVLLFGMRFIIRESDQKHIETVEIVRSRLSDTSGSHRAAS
jgi:putative hemolysin